jgi:uncharacterized membrane protein YfcA
MACIIPMISATVATLAIAAFGAGAIDAIVGGGGLIQLPALFSALPTTAPASLLGTSKCAGFFGTGSAAFHYLRRVRLPGRWLTIAAAIALTSSLAGAAAVTRLAPTSFRPLIPILLGAVLFWTVRHKHSGSVHAPRHHGLLGHLMGAIAIGLIGFYDGFFGPGTGSFLMVLAIRYYGFDFLHAAAFARTVNVATNLSALGWFIASGHILWWIAGVMAVANTAGAQCGTRLAMRGGVHFVRRVFLVVVTLLIIKTAWDALPAGAH